MTAREYAKTKIDLLPDDVVDDIIEFIDFKEYQRMDDMDETEYLLSIPGMKEKLDEGMATPLSECIPLSEVWTDV